MRRGNFLSRFSPEQTVKYFGLSALDWSDTLPETPYDAYEWSFLIVAVVWGERKSRWELTDYHNNDVTAREYQWDERYVISEEVFLRHNGSDSRFEAKCSKLILLFFHQRCHVWSNYNHYNHYNHYRDRDRDSDLDLDLDWGVVIYNQIVTWTAFAILAMFF